MAILGELARAGLLHTELPTVHSKTMAEALATWDVIQAHDAGVFNFYKAAPGGVPTQVAFSQDRRWNELDLDRSKGVIRDKATPSVRTASPCCTATSPRRVHRQDRRCR
jgi:dihydroxy-acid dehydratase